MAGTSGPPRLVLDSTCVWFILENLLPHCQLQIGRSLYRSCCGGMVRVRVLFDHQFLTFQQFVRRSVISPPSIYYFTKITLVSCVQAWYYFTHQSDRWHLKLLVNNIFLLQFPPLLTFNVGHRGHDVRYDTPRPYHTHWYGHPGFRELLCN